MQPNTIKTNNQHYKLAKPVRTHYYSHRILPLWSRAGPRAPRTTRCPTVGGLRAPHLPECHLPIPCAGGSPRSAQALGCRLVHVELRQRHSTGTACCALALAAADATAQPASTVALAATVAPLYALAAQPTEPPIAAAAKPTAAVPSAAAAVAAASRGAARAAL